ncbi:MAG: VWA domain-containing protein [Candidatus Micrarchaeota archaeon]|nr:VWA domain-containing protein [Candidatus Micrarchaeota archaeon]
MKKAQASMEQLIIIAIALAVIGVAFYVAFNYASDSTKISQAEEAVQKLAAAADRVYALGQGSKEYVTVYLPQDIRTTDVSGKRVLITVGTSAGSTDVFANSKAELTGAIPTSSGKHRIVVEHLPNGKVRIGSSGLACSPLLFVRSFDPGQSGQDFVSIVNNAEFEIVGINRTLSGAGIVSASSLPPSIAAGENATLQLSYSVPQNQSAGTYGATLTIDSENGGSCTVQITLHITGSQTCSALCYGGGYLGGTCRSSEGECYASGEDYIQSNDAGCIGQGGKPRCCCYPSVDNWGPLVSAISHSPPNATASNPITINAVCNDTATGNLYIRSADLQIDGGNWTTMSAADGAFFSSAIENVTRLVGTLLPGQHIAAVRCTDTGNNTGPTAYYFFNVSAGDVLGPIVTHMNHSDTYPSTLSNVTEYASATDIFTGNSDIQRCYMKLDNLNWVEAIPADGAYNSPTEDFYYNFGFLSTGMHTIYAYCIDSLNNVGGIANDTFGVSSADVILVIDRSGSMSEPVIYVYDNNIVSTTNATFTKVKSVTVNSVNGPIANLSTEIRSGTSGCAVEYQARVGNTVIASGVRNSTSYGTLNASVNISQYSLPITIDLYLRRIFGSSCTVYNRNFVFSQLPTKMDAAKAAAKTFVNLVVETTQTGLVSFSDSSTLNRQLSLMTPSNKNALRSAIDALSPGGNTCIRCGIDTGRQELTSSRARYPNALRIIVLLTDGASNVGDCPVTETITGASDARKANATVYTIGFGYDVNVDELVNTALITGGRYYFAPDENTLQCIYRNIGMPMPC